MKTRSPAVPVSIDIGPALSQLVGSQEARALERRLVASLGMLLQRLGLTGKPIVDVRIGVPIDRAVHVRAQGKLQRYSPELMSRVWQIVAPAEFATLSEISAPQITPGFPDGWLTTFANNPTAAHQALLVDYLERLTVEILREHPACLLSPSMASAYAAEASALDGGLEASSAPESALPILTALLDLGVSLEDRSLVLQIMTNGQALGRSLADTAEAAFARLRACRIEIHVHPDYLATLIPGLALTEPLSIYADQIDESVRDQFRSLEDTQLIELGISLPDLIWMPEVNMPPKTIAVKINDRVGLPIGALQPDEIFINAAHDWLSYLNVQGRQVTNPTTGNQSLIVSATLKETFERQGLITLSPLDFAILIVASEIIRYADRLLSVEDVEYQLAQLAQVFPELVEAAIETFSLEEITRVLRGLVREDVSIQDLQFILDRLLQYDTIAIDPTNHIVFDERLAIGTRPAPELTESSAFHLAFVRAGMDHVLTNKSGRGTKTVIGYLMAPDIEQVLMNYEGTGAAEHRNGHPDEDTADKILLAIWREISQQWPTMNVPILLTIGAARKDLRELVVSELPRAFVVAYEELSHDASIQPIARIVLDT